MEILVCLLVVSNLNLVFGQDVAIETPPAASKNGFEVQENKEAVDQLAESSQSVGQAYGNAVVSNSYKQNQPPSSDAVGNAAGHLQNGHESLSLNPIQVLQSVSQQEYVQPQQQVYLYPVQQVQIIDAEALPFQQVQENESPQALGYTSYVEHLSEKDEDELKSAMKEGSVSDIKRLVPKSGISFKIYKKDKNSANQIPENAQFNSKTPAPFSLQQKIRAELPAAHVKQSDLYQLETLSESQQTSLKTDDREVHQQQFQAPRQEQHAVNPQTVYYTQPETQKNFAETNTRSSFVRPNFKENNFNRQTAEAQQNLQFAGKTVRQSFVDVSNQKHRNFGGKPEVLRTVKPLKNLETVHYAANSAAPIEGGKGLHFTQNVAQNFNKHRTEHSFETANHGSVSYLSNSYIAKTNQLTGSPLHGDQKLVLNRLSGNYVSNEGLKPGQIIAHPGNGPYLDAGFKNGRFADSEPAKTSQHGYISHIPKSSYADIKNSQTFDHQKALEGSTSFDIKNAIDSSGTLIHPTTEIHSLENTPKQQLHYIVPEIPTPTVVIDNSIHEPPVEGHQIAPQLSYDLGGKFYHPQQHLVWTAEHLKGAFPPKDIHQQLIRLHLPKEEIFVKTQNLEFPTSVVSHVSIPQQKQPLTLHYDVPFVKPFPQELHFHPKTKTRIQPNQHLKLTQPVAIDWSLFKSQMPNYGMNLVKHELPSQVQESGKKIIPILVRKRKNRSNGKEIGVVYGKVNANRRPVKPNNRQEKNVRGNVLAEANGSIVKQFDAKGDRKNEFSVSASYKVDRSSKSS